MNWVTCARMPQTRGGPDSPQRQDTAADADRSAAEDGVVQAHGQADRRYELVLVAAEKAPVPADWLAAAPNMPHSRPSTASRSHDLGTQLSTKCRSLRTLVAGRQATGVIYETYLVG